MFAAYKTPSRNNTSICIPSVASSEAIIGRNHVELQTDSVVWHGSPLASVREIARRETVVRAIDYMKDYAPSFVSEMFGEPLDTSAYSIDSIPFILSGHQPELFHPGVWFKNYLLSSIGEKTGGLAINVVVDHDLARSLSLLTPSADVDTNSVEGIRSVSSTSIQSPWKNGALGPFPWELTFANDSEDWSTFATRITSKVSTLGINEPLILQLWPHVLNDIRRGKNVGVALAAARHRIELFSGSRTLEVPFSRLAEGKAFALFLSEMMVRHDEVRNAYNMAREAYRTHHRITNSLQPIPELGVDAVEGKTWIETPFWVYSTQHNKRRGLWACSNGDRVELSNRNGWTISVPFQSSRFDCNGWLEGLRQDGIAIRPRALMTTMFLRLAIADLFVHGIGGGKYDQITDLLIESLWPVQAPTFLVATATLHLPIAGTFRFDSKQEESEEQVHDQIRELKFAPERLVVDKTDPMIAPLLERKEALIESRTRTSDLHQWHQDMQELNNDIRKANGVGEPQLIEKMNRAKNWTRIRSIDQNRNYSIALFDATDIIPRLNQLVTASVDTIELAAK